jgi:hypothetical protein
MNKKKWALVILLSISIFGYIKLFYKTYAQSCVAKSADCIVVVDVKRVINTLIWNYITTPSEWKAGKLFSKKSDEISLKDMFILPDYGFAFHTKNQPAQAWYILLTIKDKIDFEKGLLQYKFNRVNNHEYASKVYNTRFYVSGDKVLAANAVLDTMYFAAVVNELFIQKKYVAKDILTKAIKQKCHLAMYIAANNFLKTDAVIAANFDKEKIEIKTSISPFAQYNFTESNFAYNSTSLCTAGFTQPAPTVFNLLSKGTKEKLSAVLNVNVDSVFKTSNKSYSLDVKAIIQRADSAITYTYDEEFNKVEKVVVNNVQEPTFNFTINGNNIPAIYNYLQSSNKLEKTAAGFLFTPMLLAKSYCSIQSQTQLAIVTSGCGTVVTNKYVNAVLFLNLALTKIPPNLQRYLPNNIIKAMSNIATTKLLVTKKNEQLLLWAVFEKKKNDLPLVKF